MKVLIISAEVWQDASNGGNVLSNIFCDTGFEFAQIYCNPGIPQNNLCKKYFQITDSMVLKNTFTHRPVGKYFELDKCQEQNSANIDNSGHKYNFFKRKRYRIFFTLRHIAWNMSNWRNEKLKKFIDDFDADIIFAPCYADRFMLKLTRFVADRTGKKVISYISDDAYTIFGFHISPLYWSDKLLVRKEMRKTFPYYSLVYTMTDEQKAMCEHVFGANMKILRKSGDFLQEYEKHNVGNPVKFIYAGGLYLERWKTLSALVDTIKKVNNDGIKAQLDIYTNNQITDEMNTALNDGVNSIIHSAVSLEALKQIYRSSDVALHVESFDKHYQNVVRMSFSTKIIDCLDSGCAVMAICDDKQAGFAYLKRNDAAICVSDISKIDQAVKKIVLDKNYVIDYQHKAFDVGRKNHSRDNNTKMICEDFNKALSL